MQTTDPHHAEYAGAVAGMTETYGKWKPRVGDLVRGELPFLGTYGQGVVVETNPAYVTVQVGNERLAYYPEELEFVGPRS